MHQKSTLYKALDKFAFFVVPMTSGALVPLLLPFAVGWTHVGNRIREGIHVQ